jgi:hypothetical protein
VAQIGNRATPRFHWLRLDVLLRLLIEELRE